MLYYNVTNSHANKPCCCYSRPEMACRLWRGGWGKG